MNYNVLAFWEKMVIYHHSETSDMLLDNQLSGPNNTWRGQPKVLIIKSSHLGIPAGLAATSRVYSSFNLNHLTTTELQLISNAPKNVCKQII